MRLELRAVTAGYGQTTALRDIDLIVPSGTVVALLGPNGAGKTTLLSVASGLVPARRGSVVLDDEPITDLAPEARVERGLCHITEGRSVFPGLTVQDNLRMFASERSAADQVERALSAFPRLGQRLHQVAGTMSGGEQQMLALARAYARDAPVVLLDEVSLGLAPVVVDEIFVFLERLVSSGTTLLLVEQYVERALELASTAYLLVRGQIAFAGEPSELEHSDVFEHYVGADVRPS